MDIKKFKSDLAVALEKSGLTQADLAKQCELSQSTLSLFLSDEERDTKGATLLKLWPFVYGNAEKPHDPALP